MTYYEKYIKYKLKYIELKNQFGGVHTFNNLRYLNMGAENAAFKMEDGKILRIRKDCEKLGNEKNILEALTNNRPLYFVKIFAVGKCTDLKDKQLSLATEFCSDVSQNVCDYDYVIMNEAIGKNFIVFFLNHFKDLVNCDILDLDKEDCMRIELFAKNSINYLVKIIEGFIDANTKLKHFRHNDFNYRNCHIDDSFNPTIFDFGNSTIGNNTNEIGDILEYIKGILADVEVETPSYKAVFPDYETYDVNKKNKIIKNFRLIREEFRKNKVFNYLINTYFTTNIRNEGDKGNKFLIFTKQVPQTLNKLKADICAFQ